MTGLTVSAVLAVFLGLCLVSLLFVPYVAWSYRRRGTLGLGHAALAAAAVIYAMALWTYTILPLPDPATLQCGGGAGTQLVPFASLWDLDLVANGLTDPVLVQLLANVALFVPFGMLVRHLTGTRRPGAVVVAGAGVSLLVELTQLTGVWGLYPCSYRIFDVDDLLTNTLGTAVGVVLAPLLHRIPGQEELPTDRARVVRRGRRLVGMAVDLVAVGVVSFLVYVALAITVREAGWFGAQVPYERLQGSVTIAVSVLLLLGVPFLARGATPGQLITYVRPVTAEGGEPSAAAVLIRWAVGSGGFFVVSALESLTGNAFLDWVATGWVVLAAAAVLLRHPRGLSGYVARVTVVDSRDPDTTGSRAREVDPRSLGMAAVTVLTGAFLVIIAVAALGTLSPLAGAGFAVLGVAALAVGTLALVPFLVANGVVTVRREGMSPATLLPLVTAAGLVGLTALLAVAAWTGTRWLVVLTAAVLAATAYLGFLFLAFVVYGQWYARRAVVGPADGVVVLGSRVFDDRVPPLLAARIERGVQVLRQLLMEDPDARSVLVCSGGQGPDETVPEGEAMTRYAVAYGAPEARVKRETVSRTTEENLLLSRELLLRHDLGGPVIVVTNDFHAFRAAIITREVGLEAQVVGAPTGRYYFPAAIIREYVAVLTRTPLLHGSVALVLGLAVGGLATLVMPV